MRRNRRENVMTRMLWAVTALLAAAPAYAQGVLIVQEQTTGGATHTVQTQIDQTHMRVESYASGRHTAMIFDGSAQVMRSLDLDKQTYTELDQARLQQLRQQMAQMQEQMKN